jgi:hypothetical protein
MTTIMPSCYAAHRLEDGRWEILAPDDDPRRPPWRRAAVIAHIPPPAVAPFSVCARVSIAAKSCGYSTRRQGENELRPHHWTGWTSG